MKDADPSVEGPGSAAEAAGPKVAVAGASGFVGRAFIERFGRAWPLVGLSRRARADEPGCSWRDCDLYSLLDTERALEGCEVAVYLVHSMMPTERLTQASFADLDLILADNFGRAAARAGVRRIVYLGGLIPDHEPLSPHLASRREVEHALGAHGVPVTTLRAGIVVGAEGSSFRMICRLVQRLPVMVVPKWTETRTQPIALDDVVELLGVACRDRGEDSETHDIGGPEVLTYRQMLADIGELEGRAPRMLRVPFFSPRLSRLWLSLVTGQARALVDPLVESLRHEMIADDRQFQLAAGIEGQSWGEASASAHAAWVAQRGYARVPLPPLQRRPAGHSVRSVQRLPLPKGMTAVDVGHNYARWLPTFLGPFLRVETDGDRALFRLWPISKPMLVLRLEASRSTEDRALFYIDGGLLSVPAEAGERRGRLEFRRAPDGRSVIAAVHDFVPRLPWFIYVRSQARVHLWVMRAFGRHLARKAAAQGEGVPQSLRARGVGADGGRP